MARMVVLALALSAALYGQGPEISIVLPYPGAARLTGYWAVGEEKIDWQAPGADAERCTVAFAATELRRFLSRTVKDARIRYAEALPATGPAILVGPAPALRKTFGVDAGVPSGPDAYAVRTADGRLLLAGGGREGTLYAVYAYLHELGWRWFAPGAAGEVAPDPAASVRLDGFDIRTAPDFPMFRGFWAAAPSMESADLFQWMARNRLNLWAYRPLSYPLMRKLGLRMLSGGHVLTEIMDPERPQEDGRTLFEAHPDWFPEVDGKRERKQADRYQFCVANPQALDYVARDIAERLAGSWRWTDYQNIWMLDTWAGWCQCARCRALGNDTDLYMHFLAKVRERAGSSPIGMGLAAYEGTPALEAPSRPVPEVLANGRDFSYYAPINRCYAHTLEDPACTEMNQHYARAVEGWGRIAPRFPLAVVEYYNVSKFEDLPLLFTRTMGPDFAYYHRVGVKGMTYMHPPMSLWGPRALTQVLLARLSWDSKASVEKVKQDYLTRYYGPAAEPAAEFYDHLEAAYANITAWRSWHRLSVNHELLWWKSDPPAKALFRLKHLQLEGPSLAIGPAESVARLEKAEAALLKALAVKVPTPVRLRLEEDARQLRYGVDSFHFYLAMARLHEARRLSRSAEAAVAWRDVERYAAALRSTYIPFAYEYPGAGFTAQDGLTRTQLRPLLERLRE